MSSRVYVGVRASIFVLTCLLSACGAPPYEASNGIGAGYVTEQLSPGFWHVHYAAPGANTETLQTYWLYRAAELTLEQGYDGFEIMTNVPIAENTEMGSFAPYQIAAASFFIPIIIPDASSPSRDTIDGQIRLRRHPFTVIPVKVLNAHILVDQIKPHIFGPRCVKNNVCYHSHEYLYLYDTTY